MRQTAKRFAHERFPEAQKKNFHLSIKKKKRGGKRRKAKNIDTSNMHAKKSDGRLRGDSIHELKLT